METIKIIDDKTIEVDGVIFVPQEKPEYKIPAWYKYVNGSTEKIFRATAQANGDLYDDEGRAYYSRCCTPATSSEIEAHLRKICDAKGYKKGMKVKDANDGLISIITGNEPEEYRLNYDSLVIRSNGIDHDYAVTNLYYKGKFAEILPDLKKKPETREEYEEMIQEYFNQNSEIPFATPVNKFLNQYSW